MIVNIQGNNTSILVLVRNPYLYKRSKYIDIYYYFIYNLEEKNKVTISYIPIKNMIVDSLTKLLVRVVFDRFKEILGLVQSKQEYLLYQYSKSLLGASRSKRSIGLYMSPIQSKQEYQNIMVVTDYNIRLYSRNVPVREYISPGLV